MHVSPESLEATGFYRSRLGRALLRAARECGWFVNDFCPCYICKGFSLGPRGHTLALGSGTEARLGVANFTFD